MHSECANESVILLYFWPVGGPHCLSLLLERDKIIHSFPGLFSKHEKRGGDWYVSDIVNATE